MAAPIKRRTSPANQSLNLSIEENVRRLFGSIRARSAGGANAARGLLLADRCGKFLQRRAIEVRNEFQARIGGGR
jgi:hypothetical protein